MEEGETSRPVQTEFGWHVIHMVDKEVTPYEDVRADLVASRSGPAFADRVRDEMEEGHIEVDPRFGRFDPETLTVVRITSTDPSRLDDPVRPGQRRSARGMSAEGAVPRVRCRPRARAAAAPRPGPRASAAPSARRVPVGPEQTHRTLARHLLEETHELLAAIDAEDDEAIRDELGDLLLQVTFHAQIAAEDGRWDVDDVADGLVRKLVHRHPHVFGTTEVAGAEEVLVNWERLKAEETGGRAEVDEESRLAARARARLEGAAARGRLGVRVADRRARAREGPGGGHRAGGGPRR